MKNIFFALIALLSFGARVQAANPVDFESATAHIGQEFKKALEAHKAGDFREAQALVADSYFEIFEGSGMENAVGLQSPSLKTDLEASFNQLRALAAKEGNFQELSKKTDDLLARLQAAAFQLSSPASPYESFLSSLTIIFREGFEAILIIGAIVAFLLKSGNSNQLSLVKSSVLSALGASFLTALAFSFVLKVSAAQQELIEGLTMLLACGVLFTVGHWLIAKAESDQWQRFIRNKLTTSIGAGSKRALWLTCFLAVYREGAETVLFYQALFSSSQKSAYTSIVLGFLLGSLLLALVYYSFKKGIVKIPMKPFFRVTSSLLYLLAFVFAGKAVVELQAGGYLGVSELKGWPAFPLIGFYPTVENLLLQSIFVLALMISLSWVLVHKRLSSNTGKVLS